MIVVNLRSLTETGTLWESTGLDMFGNQKFSAPQKIKLRWEGKVNQSYGQTSDDAIDSSTMYVDRPLKVGDYVFRGTTFEDTPPDDSYEVRASSAITSLDGKRIEYRAFV